MAVPNVPLAVVTAVLFGAVVFCGWVVRSYLLLRRALIRERASRRLMDAAHYQDQEALARKFCEAVHAGQVLAAADEVLTSALASSSHDPEGGPA